jgi:hypothetical protein
MYSDDDKLINDLAETIHRRYRCLTSKDHIKDSISKHLDNFFKTVMKSSILMETAFSLSSSEESSQETASDDEMWQHLSTI